MVSAEPVLLLGVSSDGKLKKKLSKEMVLSLAKGSVDFLSCQPCSHLLEMWAGLLSHRTTGKCSNKIEAQRQDGARDLSGFGMQLLWVQ